MALAIQAAAKSDVGLVRANNEDNFGYDIRHGIFVVCDGMGGQAAGELASEIAVETVLNHFSRDPRVDKAQVVGRVIGEEWGIYLTPVAPTCWGCRVWFQVPPTRSL